MSMSRRLPTRAAGLLEQRVGNDYVVVEPTTRIAYSLSGLPAEVWEATNGMSGSRYQGRASSGELNDIIANLTECGLLAPNGVPRRVVLRVGGVASMAGLVALALPSPADAASDSPGGALTLECGSNTITVGSSAQTRQVFFSITGGGGNGGGWNRSSATSGGAGGNAGVVSGSLTFPPGPVTTFILFPGCSGANGTNVGPAYGNPGLGIADTNGRSGSGGGAGGIEIAGVPFVVVGGGGGGGGAVTPPSVQPRGGDGSGAGPGSAGTTSSATSLATGAGGGGTAEAGGTAGTPTASNAAGTGPAPGPTGGIGGRPTQSGTSAAGGGGGGGYYGG
ncbi:MAG: hypothetical protein JWM76_694, partial [Pseudonocardiales bacterium]|nr:hypothetical protein [Pseudonocardiales bacterium]